MFFILRVKMKSVVTSGEYIQSLAGRKCFIPHPLPPALSLPQEIQRLIADIRGLLGEVKIYGQLLPSASVLIYGSLRREAIASSTIEGTVASPEELLQYESGRVGEREAVREVANYRSALERGVDSVRDSRLSLNMILGLHSELMRGVQGMELAGSLKSSQNFIGGTLNRSIDEAIFVPAPPERTRELLEQMLAYTNSEQIEDPIVQVALVHYQFETIHPFGDGNGRMGRLLIILHLMQLGILDKPLIYPSAYIEKHRDEYYASLQGVRDHANWLQWIEFFLRTLEAQAQETIRVSSKLLELRSQIRSDIPSRARSASVEAVLSSFFEEPISSPSDIAARVGLSYNTVRKSLESLENEGIVFRIPRHKRSASFGCAPLLKILFNES